MELKKRRHDLELEPPPEHLLKRRAQLRHNNPAVWGGGLGEDPNRHAIGSRRTHVPIQAIEKNIPVGYLSAGKDMHFGRFSELAYANMNESEF